MPASQILEFYSEHGPGIFCGPRLPRSVRQWALGKYDDRRLKAALEGVFGDIRRGDSITRVVVPTLNLETGEVVAMATAAATTYFPTHLSQSGLPLIDGGVFANNPAGLAAVEAVGVLDWQRGDFAILSLGCGEEALAVGRGRRHNLGRLYWATKLADVFMAGQSSASMGTAYLLAGHDRVCRVSPTIAEGRFGLDVVKEIPALRGLGDAEARKALPRLRELFLSAQALSAPAGPGRLSRGWSALAGVAAGARSRRGDGVRRTESLTAPQTAPHGPRASKWLQQAKSRPA